MQTNHIHLVVEAEDNDALARGMKAFTVRANRLFNAASGRRRGNVWSGRYHRADLNTPRQVRNALVYVLNNGKKHGVVTSSKLVIDGCSSAPWFSGWTMTRTVREGPRPTEEPRTFSLARLWQKHGRIHPTEMRGVQASWDHGGIRAGSFASGVSVELWTRPCVRAATTTSWTAATTDPALPIAGSDGNSWR